MKKKPAKVLSDREPTIVELHRNNFKTLQRAFRNRDVVLMDCIDRKTGEHVAAICAVSRHNDGGASFTPFATFLNGDPFELLVSPMEYNTELTESEPS